MIGIAATKKFTVTQGMSALWISRHSGTWQSVATTHSCYLLKRKFLR